MRLSPALHDLVGCINAAPISGQGGGGREGELKESRYLNILICMHFMGVAAWRDDPEGC